MRKSKVVLHFGLNLFGKAVIIFPWPFSTHLQSILVPTKDFNGSERCLRALDVRVWVPVWVTYLLRNFSPYSLISQYGELYSSSLEDRHESLPVNSLKLERLLLLSIFEKLEVARWWVRLHFSTSIWDQWTGGGTFGPRRRYEDDDYEEEGTLTAFVNRWSWITFWKFSVFNYQVEPGTFPPYPRRPLSLAIWPSTSKIGNDVMRPKCSLAAALAFAIKLFPQRCWEERYDFFLFTSC